jgi:hypothetical protein
MSLPLARRIAQAALLLGAAAAPMVGAGVASAADLPKATDLGGLTNVDGAGATTAVDGATQKAAALAGETGGKLNPAVPALGNGFSRIGTTTLPVQQQGLGKTTGTATQVAGKTANAANTGALTQKLPVGGVSLPSIEQLPLNSMPLGG